VIVSAGAINSPQLLQLSGVGPGALLQSLQIPVVHDSPMVGKNLQDHLAINYYYLSKVPTLNDVLTPWHAKIRVGLQYLLRRNGPLSISVNQAGGFVRSNPDLRWPDQQLYFTPISYTRAPEDVRPLMHPDPFSAFFLSFQPCRPTSRGSLAIRSSDPFEHPTIEPSYLSTNEDIDAALRGCRLMRRLACEPLLASIIKRELQPGPDCDDDEKLLQDFRNRSDTVFHPTSTCMMGTDPANSVTDPALKVHGVEGLRVVDASVFPNVTSGNTNAPTMMVAERAAELILQDSR
jgi:choline dehydrogenase